MNQENVIKKSYKCYLISMYWVGKIITKQRHSYSTYFLEVSLVGIRGVVWKSWRRVGARRGGVSQGQ